MNRVLILLLSLTLITACKTREKAEEGEDGAAKAAAVRDKNLVDTIVLKKGDFYRQIISNGKLRAVKKSELHFLTSGVIADIFFKNGESVKQGEAIAVLDKREALNKLEMAVQNMEKSEIDLAYELIGYSFGKDTNNVPKDMLRMLKIRTGYNKTTNELRKAREDLNNTSLFAPFSGKIANLSTKPYEQVSGVFCTL
ncbi:MAG: efflux RND transporter periplasmic adaptor subunit, partial [Bacteroidales bacterium]|nr:efflux RND transporter periplasmic adaptor subunit [Bacteroidales bacterium]